MGNIINTDSNNEVKTIQKKGYGEVEIPSFYGIDRCSVIEASADQNGISSNANKERLCTYYCGENGMNFGYFQCVTDKFHCYCEE
jgi:hypothetical protein